MTELVHQAVAGDLCRPAMRLLRVQHPACGCNTQPALKLTAPCHAALRRAGPGPATLTSVAVVLLTSVAAVLQVYKALLRGVNPVAVKVLRDHSYTSRDEFGREVGLLKTLHNSNIVQFQVRTCYSRSSTQLAASGRAHRRHGASRVCSVRRCPAWLASHISCTAVQGACVEQDKMLLVTEFMDGVCMHFVWHACPRCTVHCLQVPPCYVCNYQLWDVCCCCCSDLVVYGAGGDLCKAIARKQVTWKLRCVRLTAN